MSLYRNLGPITYHSQSNSCQIFTSQNYWIVQTSLSLQSSSETKKLIENYNAMIGNQIIQCYSEKGKSISLLMDKFSISMFDWQNCHISDFMCQVCQALIGSFQAIGVLEINQIQKSMFFLCEDKIFYLYLPVKSSLVQNQQQIKKGDVCSAIVQFIESESNFLNQLSNKLLLTKLRKCQNLSQIKDELQYFQKIYEIGARKVKKQLKAEPKAQQFNDQIQTRPKHRIYRKRSQQIHEPMIINKCHSASEHKIPSKKSLPIKNFHKYSHSTHTSSKRNFFSQRNKSFESLNWKSSTKINQFYQTGRLKNSQMNNVESFSKGLINQAKKNHSNRKTKKSLNLCSNYFFDTYSRNYAVESIIKQTEAKEKENKNKIYTRLQLAQSNIISIPTQIQQVKDENELKQKINKNLDFFKQRRNMKNMAAKGIQERPTSSKKQVIVQKDKINNEDIKFCNQIHENKKQISKKQEIKINQQINKSEKDQNCQSRKSNQENIGKNYQKIGIKNINSVQQVRKQKNVVKKEEKFIQQNILDQLQEVTLLPLNSKLATSSKQQKVIKNQYKQKLVDQNKKKKDSFDNENTVRQQKNETQKQKQPQSFQKQKQKKKKLCERSKKTQENEKQLEKEKTTRKLVKNNNQELSKIQLIKKKMEKINLIAECVMKMQSEISNLKNGDKYLWQFPAFVFYKQFYIRRLQIEQNLRQQLCIQKQTHEQLYTMLTQLQKQNIQAKQSLSKLLKVTLKKLKKYEFDETTIEESKKFLNLDLSIRWHKRVNQTIVNFVKELQQIQNQDPLKMGFIIEVCEAYLACKGEHVDFQRRGKLDFANYQDPKTCEYYNQLLKKVL